MHKRMTITAGLLTSASALFFSTTGFAQEAAGNAEAVDRAPEIIVTGSRIMRNGDAMPVPMTIVSNETLQDVSPTTIAEGLKILPVFAGSRGQFSNPSAAGGVGAGNGSAAQINLRNIGSERTLVLMDGRRVPPSSNSNFVDIDMIPQQLVQRVETVTGGVSAVYGSDAVTGVVNFIIDKNFNGLKAHAQYGISEYGDGEAFNAGAAFGTSFADGRGHIEASYEYRDDKGVLRRSERPWFNQPGVVGNGTANAPYELIENLRLAQFPFGGRITCGAGCSLNGQYFAQNGVLSPFTSGTATTSGGTQIGGDGGYQDMSLKSPLESHQIYARLDYELTDKINFFASAAGNMKTNMFFGDTLRANALTISADNAFLAPEYQAALDAAGVGTFTLRGLYDPVRQNPVARTDNWMFVAGLDGNLGDYHWDVSYTRGMSKLHTTAKNIINTQTFAAAVDAVVDPATGNIVCQASLANAAYSGCVPLNLFGPDGFSQEALGYALGDIDYVAKNYLDDVLVTVTGSPFSTWAGDVGVALSGEWRNQAFRSSSTAEPTDLANCAGIRYNCSGPLWQLTFPSQPTVSNNVWEVAGEVEVPLLKDAPLAQSLVATGAVRYTSYKTSGSYWTWKAGLDWSINDSIRVRGTISRDIRAPTLNDLYAPTSVVYGTFDDLLTQTTGFTPSVNYGNDQLKAEIGHTWTAGVVLTPEFLPGFSLAVDYYHIRISNALSTVQGFRPNVQTECYESGGTSPYCALQDRPNGFSDTSPANAATAWYVTNLNISEIETEGVDIEANYSGTLFGQSFSLRGLAAYQPHAYYDGVDYGGVAFGPTGRTATPTWRLTGIASVKPTDNFRVDILQTWRNAMKGWTETATTNSVNNHIPSFGSTTLNLTWQVPTDRFDNAEFFVNISNLFDNDPPAANATGSAGSVGGFNGFVPTDDVMGRYYTAGFRVKM